MTSRQDEIYGFILSLVVKQNTRASIEKMVRTISREFFNEKASSVPKYHQCYQGGLADHTALVCLVSYHTVYMNPAFMMDSDKVLIAALCHDLDKLGKYTPFEHSLKNDDEVMSFLGTFNLLDDEIRNGILFAHGLWTKKNQEMARQPISIIIHFADMVSSQIFKERAPTNKAIDEYIEYIKMLKGDDGEVPTIVEDVTKIESKTCPKCKRQLLHVQDPNSEIQSNFWDCLKCQLRYTFT